MPESLLKIHLPLAVLQHRLHQTSPGTGSRFWWGIEAGLETVLGLGYSGYGVTQESLCCLLAPFLGSPPACYWQASILKPECGSVFPSCAGS